MGPPLRIRLSSPYFGSTYGGGEKYLGATAGVIRDSFPGNQVEIVGPVAADRARYQELLGLDLAGIELVSSNRRVTPAHRLANRLKVLRPLRDRVIGAQSAKGTEDLDLHLAMAFRIPVHTRARRGVILCQFPYPSKEGVDEFQRVICYSDYVRAWIRRYWEVDAVVVNPPIEVPEAEPGWAAKERRILSVGRFFSGGHSKRHDAMVEAFRDLCDGGLAGWRLDLAGSAHRDGPHAGYLQRVRERAAGYPIDFHLDVSAGRLRDLYARAWIYWHAAGLGAGDADPERREHFGMTAVEAMGHGAVPLLHRSGGLLELVHDGVDGRLWDTAEELRRITLDLARNQAELERLGRAARSASLAFGGSRFRVRMAAALAPVFAELGWRA
jgi:glycosyltransferase involved in cell wall biosynthesis